ncbi:hypothetical protein D3C73_502110 [compost metagenome]
MRTTAPYWVRTTLPSSGCLAGFRGRDRWVNTGKTFWPASKAFRSYLTWTGGCVPAPSCRALKNLITVFSVSASRKPNYLIPNKESCSNAHGRCWRTHRLMSEVALSGFSVVPGPVPTSSTISMACKRTTLLVACINPPSHWRSSWRLTKSF